MRNKAGLDPRAYDFSRIDGAENAPLFRSHACKAHGGGYEDIVACMETTAGVERILRPCCIEPYNAAAVSIVAYWTTAKDTEEGKAKMKMWDDFHANLLDQIRGKRT